MPSDTSPTFVRDTSVEPLGDGRYSARLDPRWWIGRGPNGGYVAAVVLRAMLAELGDGARQPRTLTVQYPSAPAEGECEVAVTVERSGRTISWLSARLEQGGRLQVLALCACSADYAGAADFEHVERPRAPGVDDAPAVPSIDEVPVFARNFDMRPALGEHAFTGAARARVGGWIRLRERQPRDAPVWATLADAWWPAPFAVLEQPAAAPTVELTIHFHAELPQDDGWTLVDMTADVSRGGFFEEDARLFDADGRLAVSARQLALLVR